MYKYGTIDNIIRYALWNQSKPTSRNIEYYSEMKIFFIRSLIIMLEYSETWKRQNQTYTIKKPCTNLKTSYQYH